MIYNTKKHKTNIHKTKKHKTNSNNICELSSNILKHNTTHLQYNNYKEHIKLLSHSFTNSINLLPLLNEIFRIKNNINFIISVKKQPLDEYTKIPPFIEIFKYLIMQNDFKQKCYWWFFKC